MTILVIDDDSAVFETVAAVLDDDGYLCLTAGNTREADLVLETIPVHAMTLDLNIPNCDPLKWLEQVALMNPELVRRTVAVTSRVLTPEEEARVELTGAGLLLKPFAVGELRQAIRYRVGRPNDDPEPPLFPPEIQGSPRDELE